MEADERIAELCQRTERMTKGSDESESIYLMGLEAMPEAVLVARGGVIFFANNHLAVMFGGAREDVVGKSLDFLVPGIRRELQRMRALEGGAPVTSRLGLSRPLFGRDLNGTRFRIVLSMESGGMERDTVTSCIFRSFLPESDVRRQLAHGSGVRTIGAVRSASRARKNE
jgi:PAS domain-containing protein